MTQTPGKDDVHEQRHPDQSAEGVVTGGSGAAGGAQAPKRAPAQPVPREHEKSDAAAPPGAPDTTNRPD